MFQSQLCVILEAWGSFISSSVNLHSTVLTLSLPVVYTAINNVFAASEECFSSYRYLQLKLANVFVCMNPSLWRWSRKRAINATYTKKVAGQSDVPAWDQPTMSYLTIKNIAVVWDLLMTECMFSFQKRVGWILIHIQFYIFDLFTYQAVWTLKKDTQSQSFYI